MAYLLGGKHLQLLAEPSPPQLSAGRQPCGKQGESHHLEESQGLREGRKGGEQVEGRGGKKGGGRKR